MKKASMHLETLKVYFEICRIRRGSELRIVFVNGLTNRPAGENALINIEEVIPNHDVEIHVRAGIAYAVTMNGEKARVSKLPDGEHAIHIPRVARYEAVTLRIA